MVDESLFEKLYKSAVRGLAAKGRRDCPAAGENILGEFALRLRDIFKRGLL